ncbi:protein SSUH2 homolog isoform X1 [Varanus komodoensis]|uniref:Protein SSUH2 homolog n=2 Tax=Varanus komodoensis TaxID=61221 RepID=A0A8D2Q6D3_VARKO|nr:protein SSUH2 homolog isoform X1 [Varanus komodoensis]XP_044307696.1 protein SSUH2 homolog isoform X1 [Varanus komodoensis]XP_044307697.1 protein SSUH2 homolog isoform X1 [Varanus komodoensis]XP_044307698.1 protein SSUH2 homolog isoform X1 [Varanus komodoensis]
MSQVPSAPPVYDVNNIAGYEGTTDGDGGGRYFPPPPNSVPDRGDEPPPALRNWTIPAISEDEAQEALIQYVASKCCYGKAPAKEMMFQDLQSFNTYRYRLETFTESRSTVWKTEPYNGEIVDSYLCGAPPLPWDIIVDIPVMFTDQKKKIKVPHTSSVKGCPCCGCSGRRPCQKCRGLTRQQCWVCHGKGYRMNNERCTECLGTGTSMCDKCSGLGTTACSDCGGRGQLLSYIELQVVWKNNVFEYLADQRTGFPTELFKEVSGQKLFVDEQYMVYPVTGFPEGSINQASRNAIEQHKTQFGSTARILRERQTIELLFLTRVEYEWHRKSYSYFVYGNEHKVYAENYPRKCCCAIL